MYAAATFSTSQKFFFCFFVTYKIGAIPIQNLNILSKKEGMREEFSKRHYGERGKVIPRHYYTKPSEKRIPVPPEKFPLLCLYMGPNPKMWSNLKQIQGREE